MPTAHQLPPLSPPEALQKIRAGEMLRGYHLQGTVDLRELAEDDPCLPPVPLVIEHCRIDHLSAVLLEFQRPVVLRHAQVGRLEFAFTYFLQGLRIEGCEIDDYLDFQAGGHNKPGFPVQLLGNVFHGFVNFFDCWYEAEVQVEGNDFRQGTNLLGQPGNYPVRFEVPARILGNTGKLDHNDEGPALPG